MGTIHAGDALSAERKKSSPLKESTSSSERAGDTSRRRVFAKGVGIQLTSPPLAETWLSTACFADAFDESLFPHRRFALRTDVEPSDLAHAHLCLHASSQDAQKASMTLHGGSS